MDVATAAELELLTRRVHMNDPLVEKKPDGHSERYRLMADRIDHNADATFGGAVVIIPPAGGGDPIELLILDAQGNPGQFWATIMSRIQITLEDLKAKQQQPFGGGMRR